MRIEELVRTPSYITIPKTLSSGFAKTSPTEQLPLHYEFEKASKSIADIIDYLPAGFDRGAAKLMSSYKAVELTIRLEGGESIKSEKIDGVLDDIAALSAKLGEYNARAEVPKTGIWSRLKGYAQGLASFLAESSAMLVATIGASVCTAGFGGVAASVSMTYPQVFGSTLLQKMEEGGYDLSDARQIRNALYNEEFMKHAKKASHISAGQMSTAFLVAGLAAGYAYMAAAKPVEQVGANLARQAFERLTVEAGEGGARAAGQGLASLAKTGVHAAGKKAVCSVPVRSFATASKAACVAAKGAGENLVVELATHAPKAAL